MEAPVRWGPSLQSLRETSRRAFRAIQALTLPTVLLPGQTDPLHAFVRSLGQPQVVFIAHR